MFPNHDGYIFHDSRGFESGGIRELEIVRDFIRQKAEERKLQSRLHAIWFVLFKSTNSSADDRTLRYCVPMDNQRPELDLRFFKGLCPDQNGM